MWLYEFKTRKALKLCHKKVCCVSTEASKYIQCLRNLNE